MVGQINLLLASNTGLRVLGKRAVTLNSSYTLLNKNAGP